MTTKYQEYFNRMVEENKGAFDKFTQVHFDYSADPDSHQDNFNKEGEIILKIIHRWEDKLCSQSEKAGFGSFTGNLAEKFQNEVRAHYPLIDHVGIVVSKTSATAANKFSLKKIKLN